MKKIELAKKELKNGTLRIDTEFDEPASDLYLFILPDGRAFTGWFADYSEILFDKESDLHIIQFGRDGYRFELEEVAYYALISDLFGKTKGGVT